MRGGGAESHPLLVSNSIHQLAEGLLADKALGGVANGDHPNDGLFPFNLKQNPMRFENHVAYLLPVNLLSGAS